MGDRTRILATGFCLIISIVFSAPGRGSAQEKDKDAIVACMLEKTTEADKAAVRNMIIAALQGNEPEVRKNEALLEGILIDLAIKKCSMSMELMNEAEFGEIAGRYGETIGEKIMQAAFAKLK